MLSLTRRIFFTFFFAYGLLSYCCAQKLVKTYYDDAHTQLMETYEVSSDDPEIMEGRYTMYFKSGNKSAEGNYFQDEPVGFWRYYHENGQVKMQGEIVNRVNAGKWQYFHDNGQPKMQGELMNNKRVGEWLFFDRQGKLQASGVFKGSRRTGWWKFYFPNGKLKSEINFSKAEGEFIDYYPSGNIKGEGSQWQGKRQGEWRLYHDNGKVAGEGLFSADLQHGEWRLYNEDGYLKASGQYDDGERSGSWKTFYTNKQKSAEGNYYKGKREGQWQFFDPNGKPAGVVNYANDQGTFTGRDAQGHIHTQGQVKGGYFVGDWLYFKPDGQVKGQCHYKEGVGEYTEVYPNGNLKVKGSLVNGVKSGVWVMYAEDASVIGYHQASANEPLQQALTVEEFTNAQPQQTAAPARVSHKPDYRYKKKSSRYFLPRLNEFRGFIVSIAPINTFAGELPLSMEYYIQERHGIEMSVSLLREPFFSTHSQLPRGTLFDLGYAISLRQKFYQRNKPYGMLYFGHEIRYCENLHAVEVLDDAGAPLELQVQERKVQYALLLGDRLIVSPQSTRKNHRPSVRFTLDWYIGVAAGPRFIWRNYDAQSDYEDYFSTITTDYFPVDFRFGLSFGLVF
ncbi:toxin-antitoxin system YwqK family antitoxin [Persicobacter psychrovividus]|uniref:Antitoxin component YwqK of the YwqJK toxin-antitoxin module n=1 Tax=Persicobacter psychrovividus TaxID=387638 RepID=A0ABN6L647_9BACT|nr:hypothetical protein PEPS_08440 [Persicobacter psychrovividus]